MNNGQREIVLKILQNLELAYEGLTPLPENFTREDAYTKIKDAHQSVALLLLTK